MSDEPKFRIRCRSVLGHPVWVTNVSAPIDTGEGTSPIVSMINKEDKGKLYTRAEAEKDLPGVHTSHPEGEIVPA